MELRYNCLLLETDWIVRSLDQGEVIHMRYIFGLAESF